MAHMETSGPSAISADVHATSVVTWDVPSAIVAGERFTMKVGVRCASECGLAGDGVAIYDQNGTEVGTGTLGGERWPGTTAVYAVEIELQAPEVEGFYTWSARGPRSEDGAPHAEAAAAFGVRVVGRPECLVTVEAVDKETRAPLSGARVVMHPYRTVADDRGVAQLRAAKGSYMLFVSQTRYATVGMPVEVTTDMAARTELELEPESERN